MDLKSLMPLLALAALVVLPAASAHERVSTTDGKYEFVIGQLNEPVVTYAKSGLDVCAKWKATGSPVTLDAGAITATLKSPDGKTLSQPLKAQFGRAGCYQFQDPYVPTKPGQYTVDIVGTLNGTAIDFKDIKAGGAVADESVLTFPATGVSSTEALTAKTDSQAQEIAKLKTDLATLQGQLNSLQAAQATQSTKGAPAPAAPLLAIGLLAVAALVVRRR